MSNAQEVAHPASAQTATGDSAAHPAGTIHLTADECWHLLEGARLGRLAITDQGGAPDLFPVNFVAHARAIYLRTARGTKLTSLRAHADAAFEIDGEDGATRWSVVVRGAALGVDDPAELEASGAAALVPWSPGEKPFAVKITAGSVTGRRFPRAGESAGPPPAAEPKRATRPVPIPHLRPVAEGRTDVDHPQDRGPAEPRR